MRFLLLSFSKNSIELFSRSWVFNQKPKTMEMANKIAEKSPIALQMYVEGSSQIRFTLEPGRRLAARN